MFNFFRRSKKEPDSGSKKNNKDAASRARTVSPTLDRKDMCKNNLSTQKSETMLQGNSVFALPNDPTEFGLRENLTNTMSSSEVTLSEKNDSNIARSPQNELKIDTNMCDKNASAPMIPSPPTVSFATAPTRKTDAVPHKGSGVKPCGHGTTAISPYIPYFPGKRENNTKTPPSSPKLEFKRSLKKDPPPAERQISSSSEQEDGKSEDIQAIKSQKEQIAKVSPSASADALIESISESVPIILNGTSDSDAEKKNLINQEAKFQSQLNDLSKQLSIRDAEANKLRFQMEELQRDVFVKSAGMDRLEAELQAAHKETEMVRQRIRHLESDLLQYKQENCNITAELTEKSENYINYENETNAKIALLEGIVKELKVKIESLESELNVLKREKEELDEKHLALLAEREEEKKKVSDVLDQATAQKQEIEKKWKEDFEKLRTVNIMKEQQLLDDFEWKLREVHQSCKKRLDEKDKSIEERLQGAYKEAELKMKEAEDMMAQVETMKSYEMEIEQLKGLTVNQDRALKEMMDQQSQMKQAEESLKHETKRLRNLIEMEKENLQHMQRIHHNEIVDKERRLKQTLNQKRTEIAMYWEERLLSECGRLKTELEQIHNEEKHFAMETVRREKEEEFDEIRKKWEDRVKELMKEIAALKRSVAEKDEYYREEVMRTQTKKDRDIMELRRLMDKIDMTHHDRFEKLVLDHEEELERINKDTEQRIREIEANWQTQVTSLRTTLELVKEQMERESQQKFESLIEQHRSDLDAQWDNLIRQKSEAVELVEDEYVSKYKILEEQFGTQQKSHEFREIELLKTIDSLKNELSSKDSAIDDLQNNVDTLEGGIQVLNQEVAQQNEQIMKNRRDSDHKVRGLQDTIIKLQEQQEKEREAFRLKLMGVQKQNQETVDHLQRKCQCLTKLFEEVRLRYERRESKQEDLTIISDLKQVIAEQEKDLACLNEEKRYFQMRLINLENQMEDNIAVSGDEDAFEDAEQRSPKAYIVEEPPEFPQPNLPPAYPTFAGSSTMLSIPPTIPECDE